MIILLIEVEASTLFGRIRINVIHKSMRAKRISCYDLSREKYQQQCIFDRHLNNIRI